MSKNAEHGWRGVLIAAALFTAATAFFGVLAENFAAAMNRGILACWPSWGRAALGGLLFAGFTFLFWKAESVALLFRQQRAPSIGSPFPVKAGVALLCFTLMAAAHGFLGINLAQSLHHDWHFHGWWAVVVGAVGFFFAALLFWNFRAPLVGIFSKAHHRSDGVNVRAIGAPNYVAVLSLLSPNLTEPSDKDACVAAQRRFDAAFKASGNWSAAMKALTDPIDDKKILSFWNGQQPLRSLSNLLTDLDEKFALRVVRFVCTAQSSERFYNYAALLRHIVSNHPDARVQQIAFEMAQNLLIASSTTWDDNVRLIEKELMALRNDSRCLHGPICVEITGGSTDLSIAGALATVGKDFKFRYIFTNPPYHAHDFDMEARDTPME